jgi:DNA-binding transcriptional MerR regulator
MRAVHEADLGRALAAVDRSHAELDRERAEIAAVLGAFDELVTGSGRGDTADAAAVGSATSARTLWIGEVARVVGVHTSALRLWEQRGLLRPPRQRGTGYRLYDGSELRNARVIALLRRGGYPLSIVDAVLAELRTTGSPSRVRAELHKREHDLRRRSRRRLRASATLSAYLDRIGLAA